MTPEEAENFYEEDEDPQEVFAWFDLAMQIKNTNRYLQQVYGNRGSPGGLVFIPWGPDAS